MSCCLRSSLLAPVGPELDMQVMLLPLSAQDTHRHTPTHRHTHSHTHTYLLCNPFIYWIGGSIKGFSDRDKTRRLCCRLITTIPQIRSVLHSRQRILCSRAALFLYCVCNCNCSCNKFVASEESTQLTPSAREVLVLNWIPISVNFNICIAHCVHSLCISTSLLSLPFSLFPSPLAASCFCIITKPTIIAADVQLEPSIKCP